LPVDRERRIAYATFSVLTIDHTADNAFTIINFDNPAPFFVQHRQVHPLPAQEQKILGKKIAISHGKLELGDFIALISDGILYAGLGTTMNFGWGWENVARYIEEEVFNRQVYAAHGVVNSIVGMTNRLYHWTAGDDATCVGVFARQRNALMIFSGPPVDDGRDWDVVQRFLNFGGRKIICGGTTANIVGACLGTKVETMLGTMREDIPAMGKLPGVDLVTEGILTLGATLDLLRASQGKLELLQNDENGAYLLAREMLSADAVTFLVGQSFNPFYQNPLLPKNIPIRRYLIDQIVDILRGFHKDIQIEYC
jgi:hypothetical protein